MLINKHLQRNVVGIGIDIVEIDRIAAIRDVRRFSELFLTANELKQLSAANDPNRFVASRFAAKEAVIKAFPRRLNARDFEIILIGKKPTVRFIKKFKINYSALVSIAHETHYAVASACVVENNAHA